MKLEEFEYYSTASFYSYRNCGIQIFIELNDDNMSFCVGMRRLGTLEISPKTQFTNLDDALEYAGTLKELYMKPLNLSLDNEP